MERISPTLKENIITRLEAFELAEFLDVPIDEFVDAAEEYGWFKEDDKELNEFLGIYNDDDEENYA